jgi:hypothetical protein
MILAQTNSCNQYKNNLIEPANNLAENPAKTSRNPRYQKRRIARLSPVQPRGFAVQILEEI